MEASILHLRNPYWVLFQQIEIRSLLDSQVDVTNEAQACVQCVITSCGDDLVECQRIWLLVDGAQQHISGVKKKA